LQFLCLLYDANYNSCSYDHSCPNYNSVPHYNSMPHYDTCTNDQHLHLQKLLLPSSLRLDPQA